MAKAGQAQDVLASNVEDGLLSEWPSLRQTRFTGWLYNEIT